MAAVTVDDVVRVLARDVDVTIGTGASLPEEEIEAAIDSAAAEVEAKVSGRFTIPTDPALLPKLLFDLTVDVAAYLATLVFRQGKRLGDEHPISLRYKRSQELLAGIGAGKIEVVAVVVDTDPGTPGVQGPGTSQVGDVGPPLNRYTPALFGVGDLWSRW